MVVYSLDTSENKSLGIFTNYGSVMASIPEEYPYSLRVNQIELPESESGKYFCAYSHETGSRWFTSREEAEAASDIVLPYVLETIVEPYPTDHVFRVLLKKDERNRVVTRFNNHPEDTSVHAKGKFFFPDYSWTDAHPGWADVCVLRERESVGFLSGKMLSVCAPEQLKFAEFLKDWFLGPMENCKIQRLYSEYSSSYHIFDRFEFSVYFAEVEGELQEIEETVDGTVEWEEPLVDFMVRNFYPGHEQEVLTCINEIQVPAHLLQFRYRPILDILEMPDNKIIDRALREGLVYGFRDKLQEMFAFTKYPTVYCNFSLEEIQEVQNAIKMRIKNRKGAANR